MEELEELREQPLVAALPPWLEGKRQERGPEGELPSEPPLVGASRRKHGLVGEPLPSGSVVP